MRLRSPSEYYIKYLCLRPERLSATEVQERLLDEDLIPVSPRYIDKVRSKLEPPKPFYPDDPRHRPSLEFIASEKLHRMFQRSVAMKCALEVLDRPRAKEFAEVMLSLQAPLPAIAAYVSKSFRLFCSTEALDLYRHYFWNLDLMDRASFSLLIALYNEQHADHIPELQGREHLLKSAYFRSPHKTAADMPYTPMGAMVTQLRLGIMPAHSEALLRLLESKSLLALRIAEAVHRDGPGDHKRALDYTQTMKMVEEILQLSSRPEDALREQIQSIALRTEPQGMKSIHQLSGGRHTVDIAPLKDLQHESDDDPGDPESGAGDLDGAG